MEALMNKWIAVSLGMLSLAGCTIYSYDTVEEPVVVHSEPPVVYNSLPIVLDAAAGVYWDDFYWDDIWYFEATVDDGDGPYDVVSVWADVYDDWNGQLVESFELYPTNDPYVWYSDWLGHSTWLDPFYRGYTVDITAYDIYEDADTLTVWAYTY